MSICKGGRSLVYSTCTMNKKENEKQIEKFLHAHEEFSLVDEKTIFSNKDKMASIWQN